MKFATNNKTYISLDIGYDSRSIKEVLKLNSVVYKLLII
jgi:hypothetical protein